MENLTIITTPPSIDYELLDSGLGEKLERFGEVILSRPDPQVLWEKARPNEWENITARFKSSSQTGSWSKKKEIPDNWQVGFDGLCFKLKLSAFKHVGIFPEQLSNWEWMKENVKRRSKSEKYKGEPIRILNLFGYTGGATLACASAGAEVTHVDGSKTAITWARENAKLSGLSDKPIRWILDDAALFVAREVKRGKKYDAIIMDPPAFGHGPGGELWKIEDGFLPLLQNCKKVLSDNPLFFLINGYASGYSAIAYKNNLENIFRDFGGKIEAGELALEESKSKRLLPAGIFARWKAN